MSLMLGPIHTWLFNKIVIAEERAMALATLLSQQGSDLGELLARYGEPLAGKDLATLVGERSIHQFLQGIITKVQVFEASLVEGNADKVDLLLDAAYAHGKEVAGRMAPDGGLGLEEVVRLLNDTQLEGMPCDPGATFTPDASGDGVDYTHSACNHMVNWSYTGVDPKVMCRLNNRWIAGFVEGLGGSYEVAQTIADGATACGARVRTKD